MIDKESDMNTDAPTMTVIINGEEQQRTIAGYVAPGLPYPETFADEFYHRVMSSVVPTIVKSK